jgi:hypothetical protein
MPTCFFSVGYNAWNMAYSSGFSTSIQFNEMDAISLELNPSKYG